MLKNGVRWVPQLRGKPMGNVTELLEFVPAQAIRNFVENSRLSFRHMVKDDLVFVHSPLTSDQEASFAYLYQRLFQGHAALNRRMTEAEQFFVPGAPLTIDVTDEACTTAVAPDRFMHVEFDRDVVSARAALRALYSEPPWQEAIHLDLRQTNHTVSLSVPSLEANGKKVLRREIEFQIRLRRAKPVQSFRIRGDRIQSGRPPEKPSGLEAE
jgi:hypothetical protein